MYLLSINKYIYIGAYAHKFFNGGACNQSLVTSAQYLEPWNNLTSEVSRL